MFGWGSTPKCPCYPHAKNWIEERLTWIRDEFKSTIFDRRPLVFPTDDFFPDSYDNTEGAARLVLARVATLIGVPPDRLILRIASNASRVNLVNHAGQYVPHAAGTFQQGYDSRYVITVDRDELARPHDLIATFAHELSHARLLGEGRINPRTFDNELLTDLTALALGLRSSWRIRRAIGHHRTRAGPARHSYDPNT